MDDTTQINNAIAACPVGQVVLLNPGTFINNSIIAIGTGITLRGSGAGSTILNKTNGAFGRIWTTSAATSAGGNVLTFQNLSTPTTSYLHVGSVVQDLTRPSVIPSNTTVLSFTNNTVTLSANVTGAGVGSGDSITLVVPGTNGILTPQGQNGTDNEPNIMIGLNEFPGPDQVSQNLTADGQQGAFTVTIANATGYVAGQFVLLDELSGAGWIPVPAGYNGAGGASAQVWAGDRVVYNIHNPADGGDDPNTDNYGFSRPDRSTNEIKEIASVSGNILTFTSPLAISYRVSHTAQTTQYIRAIDGNHPSLQVQLAGIENLTVTGGYNGSILFNDTAFCWLKNVEVTNWAGVGVQVAGSFRSEIRDSYIHTGAQPEPGGGGYAISFENGTSEMLIENTISIDTNKVQVMRSSGTGSVVAYNFMDNGWISTVPTFPEAGINATHASSAHHVLFEGNYSWSAAADYTHGNSSNVTFFRNWLTGQRRDLRDGALASPVITAAYAWLYSWVGNLMGYPSLASINHTWETPNFPIAGWNYTVPAMSCDINGNNCTGNNNNYSDGNVWDMGFDAERFGTHPEQVELATMIRDGNYDFLTNSQRWHNTPAMFTIPNSMYCQGKPWFFTSNTWPWTNPANGTINTLPAKARYDAGTPNTVLGTYGHNC